MSHTTAGEAGKCRLSEKAMCTDEALGSRRAVSSLGWREGKEELREAHSPYSMFLALTKF